MFLERTGAMIVTVNCSTYLYRVALQRVITTTTGELP
jgi:hypothetical protein